MSLRKSLLALYPRAWRERYGEEFLAVLDQQPVRARTDLDVLASALVERAASTFTLRSARARRVARSCARFSLTLGLSVAAFLLCSAIASLLVGLPWKAEREYFAIPAFLMAGQTAWLQLHFMRHRRPGSFLAQPPLGRLSSTGLAIVWAIAIATLVFAKWVQLTSAPATPLELEGWPTWLSRMIDDPTLALSVPVMMAAAATVYHGWPNLRVSAEPPDVPRHPLGLA